MANTLAMHDLFNSIDICNTRKKFALPRQPKSPMESFGLVPGQLFRALKRHLGFQPPLPFAPLLAFQLPLPSVPHTQFAIPALNPSTDLTLDLDHAVMHFPQATLARTESEDYMFDGPGSITAEEAANIPDSLLDAPPGFIRRMASRRATDNAGDGEAGSSASAESENRETPAPPYPQPLGLPSNELEGSVTPGLPPPIPTTGMMPPLPPWVASAGQGSSAGPPPPWLAPTGQVPSFGPPRTFSHSPTPHPTTTGPPWFPMPPLPMYNAPQASNPPPSNPPLLAAAKPPTPVTSPPAAVTQLETMEVSTKPQTKALEHSRSTDVPTTPSKKAEPTSPTTPRTAGRYSKDDNTRMEMGFEEMDKTIGEIAKKLNVAPKTIYARYITRSSHCSRGGNAWNSYQRYMKVTKYMLLEMARLDNDPDLKFDFDTKPTPTADQVSASWQLFKEHHGVQDAEELMAAFEECQEQGTSQTKGARRREFDTLVKNLTTIGRQARNRSHFHVVAFAVGGMVNEDQSLSFVLENDESEGFIEKKLHMTKDRIVGRLRSHLHD
ncbi:hypothetical protein PQX77_022371 [Marasmius sp. AFHP31]|nr:hypothetical protein PQX77_022371 [Marasmius sp. AFHP31]